MGRRNLLELFVDGGAAATLGAAVSFSATLLGAGVAGAAAGAAAFGLSFAGLRALSWGEAFPLASFPLAELAGDEEAGELLLRDEDRVGAPALEGAVSAVAELLLDDALDEPAEQSRVVQLFGRQPLPTAGELQASIARHLEHRESPAAAPDAAAALSAALAELRRSLR